MIDKYQIPGFAGTCCACPRRDGQAELIRLADLLHEIIKGRMEGKRTRGRREYRCCMI